MELSDIKGVGPKTLKSLNSLGINTVYDLYNYFPKDYQDRSNIKLDISNINDGEFASIIGFVNLIIPFKKGYHGKGYNKVIVQVNDKYITAVWFNKPYIINNFTVGKKINLYGKISYKMGIIEIIEPEYENLNDDEIPKCSILPLYHVNKYINQKKIQNIIYNSLESIHNQMEEIIPNELINNYKLVKIEEAYKNIHYPDSFDELNKSIYRIKFQELLLLQLLLYYTRKSMKDNTTFYTINNKETIDEFINSLTFQLTNSQIRTISEIMIDMNKSTPMNRLIQGDVGCGKTIIAIVSMLNCVLSGYQAAMMVPTEILAEQHYQNIKSILKTYNVNVVILTSSISKKQKQDILENLKNGEIDIIIGTHSLIQENVEFKNLALVITDEQHRFGVRQRACLICKGQNPHVLIMTATPIPRTLALFVFGDMDISIIDEMPPSRQKVSTYVVDSTMRDRVYYFVKKQIKCGEQCYIICPSIEEDDTRNLKSVEGLINELNEKYFIDEKVCVLHGKMSANNKEKIMHDFVEGKIDILISTTVIEVGINVTNATIIIVESADRFGLAQLHQLRGRVGRGSKKSYCILISDSKNKESNERMKIMEKIHDGFLIAEKDLLMRGSGEFFGTRQHGIPELKLADPVKDIELMKITRDIAKNVVEKNLINNSEYIGLKNSITQISENIDNKDKIKNSLN